MYTKAEAIWAYKAALEHQSGMPQGVVGYLDLTDPSFSGRLEEMLAACPVGFCLSIYLFLLGIFSSGVSLSWLDLAGRGS